MNPRRPVLQVLFLLFFTSIIAERNTIADEQKKVKRNVAVLVFEGVELLDFAGPAEIFAACNATKLWKTSGRLVDRFPADESLRYILNAGYRLKTCGTHQN